MESVIEEIEFIKQKTQNNFNNFSEEIILQRAVERDLEIIGEAIQKMIEIDPNIKITVSKNIIGLILLCQIKKVPQRDPSFLGMTASFVPDIHRGRLFRRRRNLLK
ncbi:HepT-like ribonuclease domain-containing protein [Echinicola soli]|uniref:HepT-like ribonuclease domain-containing protein n=1 Tax=Echinicola soli TaxID=2591634 RepID=UPI0037420627